jgi:hypothetical protein
MGNIILVRVMAEKSNENGGIIQWAESQVKAEGKVREAKRKKKMYGMGS